MWLTDLRLALDTMKDEMPDFNFICVSEVHQVPGYIVFKTTYHTTIKFHLKSKQIEEIKEV
jgi:hypothetical protein